ncbi:hypothetical protein ACFQUU_21525 [Herbaspirillum sp. GCM10030257]|uniref:hypothetical protein n=1 Tax=Herbaspirillum sp. GCM10030257 TaxID=3273393 RepID=UPI00361DEE49
MQDNVRRQMIALVMQLRNAAENKRMLVLDPVRGQANYDAAQEEWNRIYRQVFDAIAQKKLLHILQFLDEQKEVLGDDAYYAGIAKLIIDQDD